MAVTSRPRACMMVAIDEAVIPFPTPLITPPTTKIYLVLVTDLSLVFFRIVTFFGMAQIN